MIHGLKPYPEYKASGVQWLGRIPLAWSTARTKTLFRLRTEKSLHGHGTELLSIYTHIGVRPRKDLEQKGNKASTTDGYWVVKQGDLIVNKLLAWMGAVGVSHFDGVTSPAYDILRPVAKAHSDYFHHLLRTKMYLQQFKSRSRGIMDMRLRLYFDQLGQIELLIPTHEEQVTIVRFLDHASERIERAIRAKRKLIALLNEQKQSTIHRAVTRGLDPNVPLKPSDIPWLGEIPKHWKEISVGASTLLIQTGPFGSQLHSHEYVQGGIPVINPSHMRDGQINADLSIAITDLKMREIERHRLCIGDIVAARRGELGRSAVVTSAEEGWLCGTGSLLIRCNPSVFAPLYFQQVFSSQSVRDSLSLASVGATMDNLNAGMVARLRLPLPPIEEQRSILGFVEDHRRQHAKATSIIEREIGLLREYRTRLIADVVTGKLDVREAARHLPATREEIPVAVDDEDLEEEVA